MLDPSSDKSLRSDVNLLLAIKQCNCCCIGSGLVQAHKCNSMRKEDGLVQMLLMHTATQHAWNILDTRHDGGL